MAVEVKYVVIREGEEKMSFTSKKDVYKRQLRQKRFTVGSLTLASSARAAILEWIALSGEARMTSCLLYTS